MGSILKAIRYRLEWLALRLVAKSIPLLPRRVCFSLGGFLGECAAMVDRRGRRIALSNLEVALGDQLSSSRRRRVMRESYRHFVRTMLDLFWSRRMTQQNFRKWFELVNFGEALAEANPGQGVIFFTFHYSNFEWAALTLGLRGVPGLTVAQEFKNPLLEPIFAELRKHSGNEIAPRKSGMIRMYRALKRGRHVAILTDLTLKPREPFVAIDTFGLKKCATYAPAWLHQRTGSPIVPCHCEPLPGGRYRLIFQPKIELPPNASIIEITQACWDRLEPILRERPEGWIWMYKHWRYKLPGATKPYPFYAGVSLSLERRLGEAMAELGRRDDRTER
jgi:Kdo2-lipid IVA lauroyltransferase/acyltransferase